MGEASPTTYFPESVSVPNSLLCEVQNRPYLKKANLSNLGQNPFQNTAYHLRRKIFTLYEEFLTTIYRKIDFSFVSDNYAYFYTFQGGEGEGCLHIVN